MREKHIRIMKSETNKKKNWSQTNQIVIKIISIKFKRLKKLQGVKSQNIYNLINYLQVKK